jgi:Zn-dependent peptidase ImmA (M78 family)/transcriptional regulator with XRE-family HTH domain
MDLIINPSMITLARESRGLTQSEMAPSIGVSQAFLSRIEAGLVLPADDTMERIANTLNYPMRFFAQTDSIFGAGISEFFHRRRQDVSSKTINRVHAIANICGMHIARMLKSVDIPETKIKPLDLENYDNSPEEIARAIRASWNLPKGPIANVVRVIEDNGGIIIRFPFGTPQMDAISRWVPGLPPIFFVNDGIPTDRERLTLCHELAHLIMHGVPNQEMETEANRFAGEFLMPEREIRPHLTRVNIEQLAALKPYWKVSMAAILHRANDLQMISDRYSRTLWMKIGQAGYKRKEPPELDLAPETPSLLQEIINVYCKHFGFGIPEFSEMLNAKEHDLIMLYNIRPFQPEAKAKLRIVKNNL